MKLIPLFILVLFGSAFSFTIYNAPNDHIVHSMEKQNSNSLTFLALGDSYTIGESVSEDGRWPVQLSNKLTEKGVKVSTPTIIATTGWRTDQLEEAVSSFEEGTYDMVSLLIGVNDQYQKKPLDIYPANFERLLKIAIERAGGDKDRVFVVSIPDYGFTPFGEKEKDRISKELDQYNRINKEIAERYNVKYFYITNLSRLDEPGMVATDKLHPSAKQYTMWVELMLSDISFFKNISEK